MQYRDMEYQVVLTANPTGWKWTVQLDGRRTKTGTGISRDHATLLAHLAIDKILAKRVVPPVIPTHQDVPGPN
jgi:hypothetical protein